VMLSHDGEIAPASVRQVSKETWIAFASLLGIAIYLIARFLFHAPYSDWALIAVLVSGAPLLFDLLKKLAALEVGSDALAGISIVTSAILGEYLAGAIIVLMLAGLLFGLASPWLVLPRMDAAFGLLPAGRRYAPDAACEPLSTAPRRV